METGAQFTLGWIDWAIIGIYVVFTISIGFILKRYMKSSQQFLMAGKSIPAWITGLAFISTNLGALEVIGMAASGAKYGWITCHFYWIGAIPAMIFLGIFMMPFYYGSKARSVPEYLKFRFDEKTWLLSQCHFLCRDDGNGFGNFNVCPGGIDGDSFGMGLYHEHHHLGRDCTCLYLPGRTDFSHIQRGFTVFPDRHRLFASGIPWA